MNSFFVPLLISVGIILPIMALAVELSTHICAGAFFDPVPAFFHQVCIALVPLASFFAYQVLVRGNMKLLPLASILNGPALVVSFVYAIFFLPLLPISFIALVFFGLGALCWAPGLAFIVSFQARLYLNELMRSAKKTVVPLDLCLSVFLIALAACQFQSDLTIACESELIRKPDSAPKNLLLLRAFGDQETMLRACYGLEQTRYLHMPLERDWADYYIYRPTLENAREVFYRATGKSFNSVPRPELRAADRFSFMDDDWYYYYDSDFAGDAVGGVARGLTLKSSRIRGEFDPNAAVEHLVWTMSFEKTAYEPRELRAQILLPEGAVVSGCWLNINGEKRDAVFQAKQAARVNYEKQARSGKQSLHISSSGPGRVLFQAPAVTSDLDLCIEIDAPMRLISPQLVQASLPSLCERNFAIGAKSQLSLLEIEKSDEKVSVLKNSRYTRLKDVSFQDLFKGAAATADLKQALEFKRSASKNIFVSDNPTNPNTQAVELIEAAKMEKKPLLIVVDGSACMQAEMAKIVQSLAGADLEDLSLIWASDKPLCLAGHVSGKSGQWSRALARLKDSACVGGQDNAAAIELALSLVQNDQKLNLLWVHGPQSIKLGKADPLSLFKSYPGLELYEFQAVPGPNQLLKSLDMLANIHQIERAGGLEADLTNFLARASSAKEFYLLKRKLVSKNPQSQINAPSFMSRLAAADWLRARLPLKNEAQNNAAIAESYRIITPLTSAVVLLDPPPPRSVEPENNFSAKTKGLNSADMPPKASFLDKIAKGKDISFQALAPQMQEAKNEAGATMSSAQPDDKDGLQTAADAGEVSPLAGAEPPACGDELLEHDPSLIPSKPEPPLSILMFCVLLIILVFVYRRRRAERAG